MKKHIIAFGGMTILAFLWTACKKDIDTSEIRLSAITYSGGTIVYTTFIEYDNSGRITKLSRKEGDRPLATLFNVSYKGNEIIMTRAGGNDSIIYFDSVTLFVNAANLAQKRMGYEYLEVKPFPTVPAQKMFFRDTTIYEYDGTGLLTKETCHHYDSNWVKSLYGRVSSEAWLKNSVTSFVNVNGNVISYNKTSEEIHYLHEYGSTSIKKSSSSEDWSFEYTKRYQNKTDFSNAAVLNQVGSWVINPMNKNYRNLPDQFKFQIIDKDENGVTTQYNSSGGYFLKYNSYGFLVSNGYDDQSKTSYIYNK